MPLWTSETAAFLITTTLLPEPVSTRVFFQAFESMRIEAKTNTTSAMPEAVKTVVSRRVQRLRKLYETGIFI